MKASTTSTRASLTYVETELSCLAFSSLVRSLCGAERNIMHTSLPISRKMLLSLVFQLSLSTTSSTHQKMADELSVWFFFLFSHSGLRAPGCVYCHTRAVSNDEERVLAHGVGTEGGHHRHGNTTGRERNGESVVLKFSIINFERNASVCKE